MRDAQGRPLGPDGKPYERRHVVVMTESQFGQLMDKQIKVEMRVETLELNFAQHDSFEKKWRDDVLSELRANTEITKQIRDAKTFARISAWVISSFVALVIGTVALLAALKSLFGGGDDSLLEWLRSWWRD